MADVTLVKQAAQNLIAEYRKAVESTEAFLKTNGEEKTGFAEEPEAVQVRIDLMLKYYGVDADTITAPLLKED